MWLFTKNSFFPLPLRRFLYRNKSNHFCLMSELVKCNLNLISNIYIQVKDEDEAAAVEADWKFAAMVIDRLCLIVYTLFTIIASLTVLWTAPHVIVP